MTDRKPKTGKKKTLQFRRLSSPPDLRRANQSIVNALLAGTIDSDVANSVFKGLKNIQLANDAQLFDARLEHLEARARELELEPGRGQPSPSHARH